MRPSDVAIGVRVAYRYSDNSRVIVGIIVGHDADGVQVQWLDGSEYRCWWSPGMLPRAESLLMLVF